jgi:hypothetical protein
VLAAGQVLTQPEAQLRWFEAALANRTLRKHLSDEQIAIYERMAGLIRESSAAAIFEEPREKLLAAGYDDADSHLAL